MRLVSLFSLYHNSFFVKENVLFHPYMPIFEASMSIIVDFEELYVQISVSAKMRYNLILAEYDL